MNSLTPRFIQIKTQVSKMQTVVEALVIKNEKTFAEAINVSSKIKAVVKMVRERMEAPVKRAYQAYKDIKAEQEKTFGGFLVSCEEAERIVKEKMATYHNEQERIRKEQEEKLAARVEKGTMKIETATQKLEEMKPVEKTVDTGKGKVSFKKVKKFKVVDMSKLPLPYHLANETEIRRQMYAGVELPGCEYWEEDQTSVY